MNFKDFKNIPNEALKNIAPAPEKIPGDLGSITGNTAPENTPLIETDPGSFTGQQQPGNGQQWQQPGQQQQSLNVGQLLPASTMVDLVNIIMPKLIVILLKKTNGIDVNAKQLSATESEKNTIQPVLQNYLNSINFNMNNPFNALILVLGTIYGMKTIEIIQTAEIPKETLRQSKPQEHKGGRKPKDLNSAYMRKKREQEALKQQQANFTTTQ